ncbi:MAG: hypothetical protein O3C63_07935 [Cyanobacteria bacterium]|nr:hypothetical protein [Cyanobacteriota bacterium]
MREIQFRSDSITSQQEQARLRELASRGIGIHHIGYETERGDDDTIQVLRKSQIPNRRAIRVRNRLLNMEPDRRQKYQNRLAGIELYEDPKHKKQVSQAFRANDNARGIQELVTIPSSDNTNSVYASPGSRILELHDRNTFEKYQPPRSNAVAAPFSQQGMEDGVTIYQNPKHASSRRQARVIDKVKSMDDPQRKQRYIERLGKLRQNRAISKRDELPFDTLMNEVPEILSERLVESASEARAREAFYNPANQDVIPVGMKKVHSVDQIPPLRNFASSSSIERMNHLIMNPIHPFHQSKFEEKDS